MLVGIAVLSALIAVVRPGLRPDIHRWIACIGLLGSLAACALVLLGLRQHPSGIAVDVLSGGFVVDSFALFIAILACVTALITCLISDSAVRTIPLRTSAYYALILVSTAAVEAIAAERDMITLFVALGRHVALPGCARRARQDQSSRRRLVVRASHRGRRRPRGGALRAGALLRDHAEHQPSRWSREPQAAHRARSPSALHWSCSASAPCSACSRSANGSGGSPPTSRRAPPVSSSPRA